MKLYKDHTKEPLSFSVNDIKIFYWKKLVRKCCYNKKIGVFTLGSGLKKKTGISKDK